MALEEKSGTVRAEQVKLERQEVKTESGGSRWPGCAWRLWQNLVLTAIAVALLLIAVQGLDLNLNGAIFHSGLDVEVKWDVLSAPLQVELERR